MTRKKCKYFKYTHVQKLRNEYIFSDVSQKSRLDDGLQWRIVSRLKNCKYKGSKIDQCYPKWSFQIIEPFAA